MQTTQPPTLTLRPATRTDIPALARLLVQLYHAELPGTLRGPIEGQHALLAYTLERGNGSLFRRYVAVNQHNTPVATASLRLARDRVLSSVPPGTMRQAFHLLGAAHALRLFALLLSSALTPKITMPVDGAYLHSLVVDAEQRGRGVGAWLVGEIEQLARADGARTLQLRVVVGNNSARRLYERLGYQVGSRTPPLVATIAVATDLMTRSIAPPA